MALTEKMPGATSTDIGRCVERLARLQLLQKNYPEFRPWMQRALQLMDHEPDPQVTAQNARQLDEFVGLLESAGQTKDALQLAEELAARRNRNMHVLGDLL